MTVTVTEESGRFFWRDAVGDVFRSPTATANALVAVGLAAPGVEVLPLPPTQTNRAFRAGDRFIKVYRYRYGGRREVAALTAGAGRLLAVFGDVEVYAIATPWVDAVDAWTALAAGADLNFHQISSALAATHRHLATLGETEVRGTDLAAAFHQRLTLARRLVPDLSNELARLAVLTEPVFNHAYVGQRVHGDFHLGQVLLTTPETIVDFEGEPGHEATPNAVPLVDLVGLLRSLDYAWQKTRPDLNLKRATKAIFCGYRRDRTETPLLTMLYADRAVYELIYESRNRPDWVEIPRRAIVGLAAKEEPWHSISRGA